MRTIQIDAANKYYTVLNQEIRKAVAEGAAEIVIDNVLGQRFIADGLTGDVTLSIHGTTTSSRRFLLVCFRILHLIPGALCWMKRFRVYRLNKREVVPVICPPARYTERHK
jgi:hypothetical protein